MVEAYLPLLLNSLRFLTSQQNFKILKSLLLPTHLVSIFFLSLSFSFLTIFCSFHQHQIAPKRKLFPLEKVVPNRIWTGNSICLSSWSETVLLTLILVHPNACPPNRCGLQFCSLTESSLWSPDPYQPSQIVSVISEQKVTPV